MLSFAPVKAAAFGKSDVGTSGAAFLKIGPGARPAGMGEAFTGVADDIHAAYWNPAGLATLKTAELTGMHMQYFQNINYEYAAFAYPTERYGTLGLSLTNLHTDDIQRRAADTDAPIDTFGASDDAYWLSYAYPLTDRLSLGANAKYIRQTLDSTISNAYAMDGGLLYDLGWKSAKAGASLQNFGTQVKFADESDPLPLTMRLGVSARPLNPDLLLSSDLIIPRDHQLGLAFGGEYHRTLWDGIGYSLRAGYRTDSDVSGFSGVSAGGGLDFGPRVSCDFAWVPFGDLGNTYRYALHIKFGPAGGSAPKAGPEDNKVLQKVSETSEPPLNFFYSN